MHHAFEVTNYFKETGVEKWTVVLGRGGVKTSTAHMKDGAIVELAMDEPERTVEIRMKGSLPITARTAQMKEVYEMLTDEKFYRNKQADVKKLVFSKRIAVH